jgi:hypothetical protein
MIAVMKRWMQGLSKRWMHGLSFVLVSIVATVAVLAAALAWGPHQCKTAFPMVIGCAIGSYESLAGGMIAASAALIAGWFAWSAVQRQIDADERRAIADWVEVEAVLKQDVDNFAEALAAIWKILEGFDESPEAESNRSPEEESDRSQKIAGVIYGIEAITKESWLSTSRRMVTALGWERRRTYEELFDGLERLGRFRDVAHFDASEVLSAVSNVGDDFEAAQPDSGNYFEGLFRRGGKAWSLGYAIEVMAGVADN